MIEDNNRHSVFLLPCPHKICIMKKLLLSLFTIFCIQLNAQHWMDAYKVGQGSTTAGGWSFVETDAFNNVIFSGSFTGTLNIDGNIFASNGGVSALFIKRDAARNFIWGKALSCGKTTFVQGLYTDNANNIYVTGFFGDSLTSSTLNCNPFPLSNTSGFSTFVVKYDPSGAVIWSRALQAFPSSSTNAPFFGITGNGTNRVAILSPIKSVPSLTVGASVISSTTGCGFYAVLDDNGNWLNAEALTVANNNLFQSSISMAANNDIYIAGGYRGSIGFGSTATFTTPISNPHDFLCKVSSAGGFAWAKPIPNGYINKTKVLTVGNDALLLGTFTSTMALGSTTINAAWGITSIYYAKIDNAGNWVWLKKYGNGNNRFFAADRNNNKIYISGGTESSVTTNTINTLVLNYSLTMSPGTPTTNPCFVIESDLNGNPVKGAVCYLGFSTVNINDIAAAGGRAHITGVIGNTVVIGNYTLTGAPINAYNFVATYADSASLITGRTFYDMNSNNVWDAGDINYQTNLLTSSATNSFVAYSNGSYKIPVNTGTYTTSLANTPPLYYTAGGPSNYVSTFTVSGQLDTANHFWYKPIANQNDLKVKITMGQMRPGFVGTGFLNLTNVGTTVKSGTLTMVLSPSISVISSTPAPLSVSANTVNYTYTNLNPSMINKYVFTYSLSNSATLGTKAKSYVFASDPLDLTPIDNSDTANVTVTGSFDPNDKRVNPEGNITPTFVSSGNYLDYTINFQNTGTDTAFTVIIKDTISNFLDLSTFQFVASSKPVLIDINANIIDFKFYNILLPDSNVNEPASHGFVSYRIKPKSTATLGDVIKNTAFIYFDFNSPIVTNTTSTPIQLVSGIEDYKHESKYKIYPNPTAYSLFLSSKSSALIGEVKIYNAEGRLVQSNMVNASEAEINVSGLASGLYLLNFQIGDTHITKKFIKN